MGLDITYYERIQLTDHKVPEGGWCENDDGHVQVYHLGFPLSFAGLEENRCYEVSGEVGGFRAGSYSGYNAFREALWEAANPDVSIDDLFMNPEAHVERPFFLLCDFADNEGYIGPEACRALASDFERMRETVRPALVEASEWWGDKYDEWANAFAVTAQGGGMVGFH